MNIEIANRLVTLRKEKGFSQEDVAEKLGISRQAVSKWERAEASPDTDNLIALSKLYGVSLDELLSSSAESIENERYAAGQQAGGAEYGMNENIGEKSMWRRFPISMAATIIYLLLGFLGGLWHPGWIVFLSIPLYYGLINFLDL